jgi:hypothetical protein
MRVSLVEGALRVERDAGDAVAEGDVVKAGRRLQTERVH